MPPSKHRLSADSQSGTINSAVESLREAVRADVHEAKRCDLDAMVKYFVSLCLNPKHKVGLDLHLLQDEIEEAEAELYYGKPQENETDLRATIRTKTSRRNGLLETAYQQCLNAVLVIANDENIQILLRAFYETLKEPEVNRYSPVAELLNLSLEWLKELKDHSLRDASELDIQFQVTDRKVVHSDVDARKPDLIGTSRRGLESRLKDWSRILFSAEFQRSRSKYKASKLAEEAVQNGHVFDSQFKGANIILSPLTPDVPSPIMGSASASSSKKRSQTDRQSSDRKTKRKKSSGPSKSSRQSNIQLQGSSSQKEIDGKTQLAMYALEMMSNSQGVHHVVNLLFMDEYLTIWYYDRQGLLESYRINLIANLPRVLVLLLVFQRFELSDWGIISKFNPASVGVHSGTDSGTPDVHTKMTISLTSDFVVSQSENSDLTKVDAEPKGFLSNKLRCLSGRATVVLRSMGKIAGKDEELACKISHPEVKRSNEGITLKVVRKIANEKDPTMLKHLPTLLFYGDVKGTGTRRIRSILGIVWKGDRIQRVLITKRLDRLTTLTGTPFIKAWLDTVTCHAFLWKHGVEHGDPSLYNSMVDPTSKCGVLTDYDLAIYRWLDRQPGTDRTGTVPFMAIELLEYNYWEGNIVRYYHHELEAFIWVLPFVFLLYTKQERGKHHEVDSWITHDYDVCHDKKARFYEFLRLGTYQATKDFASNWIFGRDLCHALRRDHHERERRMEQAPQPLSVEFHLETSENMWNSVLKELNGLSKHYQLQEYVDRLLNLKLVFANNTEHLPDIKRFYEVTKRRPVVGSTDVARHTGSSLEVHIN